MKEEQIEKAARDLCTTDRQEQWLKDFGTACFADGARWRINSVWHDRTDTPHGFALILSENADGTYDLQYTLAKDTRRWAYVRDLIHIAGKEGAR